MHTIALKTAFSTFAALEARLHHWEEVTGLDVMELTGGQGEYERQEIVYDVLMALQDEIQALADKYSTIEVVYGVSDELVTLMLTSFDELDCFDTDNIIAVARRLASEGALLK